MTVPTALLTAKITGGFPDLAGRAPQHEVRVTLKPVTTQGAFLPDRGTGDLRTAPLTLTSKNGVLDFGDLPRLPQPGLDDLHWHAYIKPLAPDASPLAVEFELTQDRTWQWVAAQKVSGVEVTPSALQQALDAAQEARDARDEVVEQLAALPAAGQNAGPALIPDADHPGFYTTGHGLTPDPAHAGFYLIGA